ncbi:hypothetical protein ACM9NK_29955, partial [Pseudomonas paraeruginosa]
FFHPQDGIRDEASCLVGSEMCIRDRAKAQAGTLTPAIPDGSERRELIKARLKELKIEFDGRQGEEALAALLPEGELAKLFPAK